MVIGWRSDLQEQALFLGDLSVYPPPKEDQDGKARGLKRWRESHKSSRQADLVVIMHRLAVSLGSNQDLNYLLPLSSFDTGRCDDMLKKWSRSWGDLICDEEQRACQCPEPLAEACKEFLSVQGTITEVPIISHIFASPLCIKSP